MSHVLLQRLEMRDAAKKREEKGEGHRRGEENSLESRGSSAPVSQQTQVMAVDCAASSVNTRLELRQPVAVKKTGTPTL